MTNKVDGLNQREANLGTGQEETVGVASTGFHDPTGDYTRRITSMAPRSTRQPRVRE